MLSVLTTVLLATSALAVPLAPRSNPLPFDDGFPSPNPDQLKQIFVEAHGTLSNSTPPAQISADGITNLQLINFAERIEAVFFKELLNNVTSNQPGYEIPSWADRDYVIEFLNVVQKTEELHNLNAVGALANFKQPPIRPCTEYHFPVNTFQEAITLAMTLTSNVFGVLGDVATVFAQNGDAGLVRGVLQAATAEGEPGCPIVLHAYLSGEQNGFYRYLLGRTPQELPFTTASNRDFAFTALQSFVDPASCPDIGLINLKTFAPLGVLDTPGAQTQDIRLSLSADKWQDNTSYNVVYVNQLNVPVVLPVNVVSNDGTTVIVSATFPYDEHLMNGLTVVSVTDQAGPFANVDVVAENAIWAPGFIVVN